MAAPPVMSHRGELLLSIIQSLNFELCALYSLLLSNASQNYLGNGPLRSDPYALPEPFPIS